MKSMKTQVHRQIFKYFIVLAISASFLFAWQNIAKLQDRDEAQKDETANVSIRAEKRGFPHVNFKDGKDLMPQAEANQGSPPKVLASADFDSDGIADLVTADTGGTMKFYRGNADSLFPYTPQARQRKAEGTFLDSPFHQPEKSFALNVSPDYLETGDFNADGRKDVLAVAKNDNRLQFLAGDGAGNFAEPFSVSLEGRITAFASGEIGKSDGQADVVVAVSAGRGSQLLVFEHPESAFKHKPEVFKLASPVTDLAIGNLDDDFYADIAVAGGNEFGINQRSKKQSYWQISIVEQRQYNCWKHKRRRLWNFHWNDRTGFTR